MALPFRKSVTKFVALLCVAGLSVVAHAAAPSMADVHTKLASMSVPFVPNAGQWDKRAAFAAQTFAGTMFVTTEGQLVYSLPGKPIAENPERVSTPDVGQIKRRASGSKRRIAIDTEQAVTRTPGWALVETLVDTHGSARVMSQRSQPIPIGDRLMEGKVSYAIGNDTNRHAQNLNTYERVNLGDMYPGINVQLRATGNNVEKIFTVDAHQDASQIQIQLEGASKLEIGDLGELIAHTGNGAVAFTPPIAFQESELGERVPVQVSYSLDAEHSRYSFTLGAYDPGRPLVIDPLLQSTYLGGSWSDWAFAIAIHPATGEVYVAGETSSADFPGVTGGSQRHISGTSGASDAYITRFNAALTSRLQSTYYGGGAGETASALAIHPTTGDVYIAGYTRSSDLPGVMGGAQSAYGGGPYDPFVGNRYDAFVARFNAALTIRWQSTYLGGTGDDIAWDLAIHPTTGEIYIAGSTMSPDLPGVAGGAQTVYDGYYTDAFVARFDATLTTRLQSTYVGGRVSDDAFSLAIHPTTGEIYIAGVTSSDDLPKVVGGAQSAIAYALPSIHDAFVTRLNAALTSVLQTTYLGGTGDDQGNALAIHPTTGEVYVAGLTESPDLPGTVGGAQAAHGGLTDAFVARFNPALTTLLQSTYHGGSSGYRFWDPHDEGWGLAIHPASGDVYLTGRTQSNDLPGVAGGAQSAHGGGPTDAYITRFNAALTTLLQSTYHGGSEVDNGFALAIHPVTGEVYVVGDTSSPNLPGRAGGAQSANALDSTFNETQEGFVSRFTADLRKGEVVPPPVTVIQPVPTLASFSLGLLILLLLSVPTVFGVARPRLISDGSK